MKKIIVLIISAFLLSSCHPSADEYFGTTALNCNTFSRFGSEEIKEFLMGSPQTYDADKKVMRKSTFQEYFKFMCVDRAIEGYDKVKDLPVTDDTKPMISASLKLYEFVVPKYQSEYLEIAKIKDENQPQSKIDAALQAFDNSYLREYVKRYEAAWDEGFIYAKKHGINVTTVNPRPTL